MNISHMLPKLCNLHRLKFIIWLGICYLLLQAYAIPGLAEGPTLRFDHLSVEDGLSQSVVTAILQDNQGFMWFGTQDGLNKYDGHAFTIYKFDPDDPNSLSDSFINSLYLDRDGFIWVGTAHNGLNRIDPLQERFIRFKSGNAIPNSLSHPQVNDIYQDDTGTFWITTLNGLNKMVITTPLPEGNEPPLEPNNLVTFSHYYFTQNENEESRIGKIIPRPDGTLWLSTSDGYKVFNPQTETFNPLTFDFLEEGTDIARVYVNKTGVIWVGSKQGLHRFEPTTETVTTFTPNPEDHHALHSSQIGNIYEDSQGFVWISVDFGLNRFDPTTETFQWFSNDPGNPTSLSSGVFQIYEDTGGIIWLSTPGSGLNIFNPRTTAFKHYRHTPQTQSTLTHNMIWSLFEDKDGLVWIGHALGVDRLDRKTETFTFFDTNYDDPDALHGTAVGALYQDKNGTLWLGSQGILNKFNSQTETFSHYFEDQEDEFNISNILSITEDENGWLWIGGNFLVKFNPETEEAKAYRHNPDDPNSIGAGRIAKIIQDKEGNLWLAVTGSGLTKFNPQTETFTHYTPQSKPDNGLTTAEAAYVHIDAQGTLWLTTHGHGIFKFHPETETFTNYRQKDGLANDFVYTVLDDAEGNLWAVTNQGISKFNPQTETFITYTDKHGLQSNEFNQGAYYQSDSGEMFVGGINGFNTFYPQDIQINSHIPPVVITKFSVADEIIPPGNILNNQSPIDLSYQDDVLTFEFVALDYANPAKNQYRYKMDGFDKNWRDLGTNLQPAIYTNLDGGNYTFQVQASNNDGVWNETGLSIPLNIAPPPWKTWWAYTLYLVGIIGVVMAYVRYRTNIQTKELAIQHEKLKQERLIGERLRLLDKLKDEFLANTSHELRTPINGIVGLAESLIEGATGQLSTETIANLKMIASSGWRLTNLVDDLLDFSKLKHKNLELNLKPVDMRSITDVILTLSKPLVGQKKVRLINNIPPDVPLVEADENRIQQIMHNLVGNAIKFTRQGQVEITAKAEENHLLIQVIDTGIGIPTNKLERVFESFEQINGSIAREFGGTGIGLTITKQLVELHGGKIWATSTEGQGTTFTFSLPLSKTVIIDGELQQEVAAASTNGHHTPDMDGPILKGTQDGQFYNDDITTTLETLPVIEGNFNILVVDDEPINLQVLVNHLSTQNYTITQANSGSQALKLIEDEAQFDLILLDIMMPNMSGYEVCQKLRILYPAHRTPIVMLTAKNQVGDLIQAFGVGANDYLTKPISRHELRARIQTHLRLAKINEAFSRFVPAEFLQFLNKESIIDVHLGDQVQKEMTILFADVRSFTTLSEEMSPKENFDFLNSLLGTLGPIIRKYNGFIDKYIGDAIMALFPQNADEAVQAGIVMQQQLISYNLRREAEGLRPVRIGIGLHTGSLMLGTIGEQQRMESTVISDAVNLTARIEGLSKVYGVNLIISEATYNMLADATQYNIRFLDKVQVKGKKEVVSVYEVCDAVPIEELPLRQKTKVDFEKGVDFYHTGDYAMAETYFKKVLQTNSRDIAAQFYLERIKGHEIIEAVPKLN